LDPFLSNQGGKMKLREQKAVFAHLIVGDSVNIFKFFKKKMAVLGLLVLCGSALAVDGNEPIAHWTLDEGSGTIAYDSAGDNDGNVYGAVWTTGQIDGALSFDGVNDYVDCGTGPALTGTGDFTVSAWVKTESTAVGVIVNQRSTVFRDWDGSYMFNVQSTGYVHFAVYNEGHNFNFESNIKVNDGIWHHIVGVRRNSTDGEIYIDGNLDNTGTGPAKSLLNVPVVIGRWNADGSYFNGKIDEVRIYDRALSAEEIQANMYMRLTGNEPNLVAYWNFDEGQGQDVYDLSPNGNDGAIIGAAWVEPGAPVDICTMQQLIERNISAALELKWNILDEIEVALDREYATFNMLIELLRGREHGDWSRKDIIKARHNLHLAIQPQHHSLSALEKSIEKLEDTLSILGYEVEPNEGND